MLDRVHRFGGGIAELAEAIRRGDADAALDAARGGRRRRARGSRSTSASPSATDALAPVRDGAVAAGRAVIEAAARAATPRRRSRRSAPSASSAPTAAARTASRPGRRAIEGWLASEVDDFGADDRWYVGRPLLVTENDYELRLYNGDTGVVVAARRRPRRRAAFERRGEIVEFSPTRLGAVDTVYAMTIHKSQGSQFDTAAVLLPAPASRILTRELLYTAVTRARERLILAGTEEAIRAAVERPVARASGLRGRLWG